MHTYNFKKAVSAYKQHQVSKFIQAYIQKISSQNKRLMIKIKKRRRNETSPLQKSQDNYSQIANVHALMTHLYVKNSQG